MSQQDLGRQEHPPVEKGPTEKLRESGEPGSEIPGAQNPESEEIKQEKSPNTE